MAICTLPLSKIFCTIFRKINYLLHCTNCNFRKKIGWNPIYQGHKCPCNFFRGKVQTIDSSGWKMPFKLILRLCLINFTIILSRKMESLMLKIFRVFSHDSLVIEFNIFQDNTHSTELVIELNIYD